MLTADPISKIQLGEPPLPALYRALATDGNGLDSEQAALRLQRIRASKPHAESGARKVMATLVNQFRPSVAADIVNHAKIPVYTFQLSHRQVLVLH